MTAAADLGSASGVQEDRGRLRSLIIYPIVLLAALGVLILYLTGYYTSTEDRPVRQVAGTSRTGAATVILSGFSLGLESAVFTALVAVTILPAFLAWRRNGAGSSG